MVEEAHNEQEEHQGGRFIDADPDGGVYLRDKDGIVSRTIKELLGKIGANLLTGNIGSIMSMRTPAYSHSHLTYLDSTKAEFHFLEHFLE